MMWLIIFIALALQAEAFKYLRTDQLTPKYRPNAKRVAVLYGPVNLLGKTARKPFTGSDSMDVNGQAWKANLFQGLPRLSTVIAARWSVKYKNGTEAGPENDVYLHHLISSDMSKPKSSPFGGCNGFDELVGAQFNNRGQDSGGMETLYSTPDGSFNSGYHFGLLPILRIQYDLINYSNEPKEVYLELMLEYVDGILGVDTGTILKSVDDCGQADNLVVNGTTKGKEVVMTSDTTIVWASGHLHPGGKTLSMDVNGRRVCQSEALYDNRGVINGMTLCPVPITLRRGDKVVLSSEYDFQKHPLRPATDGSGSPAHSQHGGHDVMGMMGISYTINP